MNIPDTPYRYAPSFKALSRVFKFEEYVDLYLMCNASACSSFNNFIQAKWVVEDTYLYYMSQVQEASIPVDVADLRLTLIAALFKDVNHGCGTCSDQSNITRAILSLHDVLPLAASPLTAQECKVVNAAITSSWFEPNLNNPEFIQVPLTLGEKAIRDSDQSMVFRALCLQGKIQFEGFLDMLNVSAELSGRPLLTLRELVDHTHRFLTRVSFWTPLGNSLRDRYLLRALQELHDYAEQSPTSRKARLQNHINHPGWAKSLWDHLHYKA